MRVLVFFDLPVKTPKQRKLATAFRNNLIKSGYYMMQFSVYAKLCNGIDSANLQVEKLKKISPATGSVRCMLVTEKQYASITIIQGQKNDREEPASFYQISFL